MEKSYGEYLVPIPEDLKQILNAEGKRIGESLPKGWGFSLLIFNFGRDGSMAYISNADRQDMIRLLREFERMLDYAPGKEAQL